MKLRIAGTEICISIGVLPILAFCIISGEGMLLICALIALILHECAHLIAARNLGYAVSRLSLYPFGAVMHLSALRADVNREWIVAAAGPLASFITASATRTISALFGIGGEWADNFYSVNLIIACVNMLPAYPLDGGRIAKSVLLRICSEKATKRLLLIFTFAISIGLTGLTASLLLHGIPAWTIAAVIPFLVGSAIRECAAADRGTVTRLIERNAAIQGGQPQKAQILVLHTDATIGEAMSMVSKTRYSIFYVTDGRQGFAVDEDAVLRAASAFGYTVKLKDAFDRQRNLCYNILLKKSRQIGDET